MAESNSKAVVPCKNCGSTDRHTYGQCRACKKACDAAYYAANTMKVRASSAAWQAANPDKKKASNVAWNAANPEARRIMSHNKRARQRENGGVLSKGLAEKLFKLQRGMCSCCNHPLGVGYQLDHIEPIALGGKNIDSNIQLLRQKCNRQKYSRDPIEFMQSRGFLL